jgi:methylenetetrahydrofolate dehydrogenase (NADP+)/methenyltetrahydrofolate cyclohydrolase
VGHWSFVIRAEQQEMAAQIIDGTAIGAEIRRDLQGQVQSLRERGIVPCLAVVLVGDNPASRSYIGSKIRVAREMGIASEDRFLPESTSQEELLTVIRELNENPAIHAILVQVPLPAHIDKQSVLEAVHPAKDVDGFHPVNVGRLLIAASPLPPCTPAGIIELLDRTGVALEGAEAVVVGRSDIVGKPVAVMLLHRHATVTICHSRTRDLPGVCRRADVLVVAIGRAHMVDETYVKPGAVVIDVGNNRLDGKLTGDVDFDRVAPIAGAITPVPGGVGPLTIAMLMRNTITAARDQTSH